MSAILTDITHAYQVATTGWFHYLFPMAQHVFAMLAIIEIAWAGILWAIEKSDVTSLWSEFLQKVISLGFFYTLLIYSPTWMPLLIQGFMHLGAGASHLNKLYPSDILAQGIHISSSIVGPLMDKGILSAGFGLISASIASLIVIISFALIAAEMVASLIESYIVLGAGMLLLGFSASRFTAAFSSNYINYAFGVGVKLFMLYLIIGVGSNLASQWSEMTLNNGALSMTNFFEVIGGALVFLNLAKTIPHKAESLLSGALHASHQELKQSALQTTSTSLRGMQSGVEAMKQGRLIAQEEGGGLKGALRGGAQAGTNLAYSVLRSKSGVSRSSADEMTQRTQRIKQHYGEKREQIVANKLTGK